MFKIIIIIKKIIKINSNAKFHLPHASDEKEIPAPCSPLQMLTGLFRHKHLVFERYACAYTYLHNCSVTIYNNNKYDNYSFCVNTSKLNQYFSSITWLKIQFLVGKTCTQLKGKPNFADNVQT